MARFETVLSPRDFENRRRFKGPLHKLGPYFRF